MKFEIKVMLVSMAIVVLSGLMMVAYFAFKNKPSDKIIMATDTSKGWSWFEDDYHASRGTVRIEDGAVRCDCTKSNGLPRSLILCQFKIVLEKGHIYRVSFKARASAQRKLTLGAGKGLSTYEHEGFGLDETYDIGPEWSEHAATFTATGNITKRRVEVPEFGVGDQIGTVWIKDVVFNEVK
jgi:hypothetical protein